jgi:hypothetical protein
MCCVPSRPREKGAKAMSKNQRPSKEVLDLRIEIGSYAIFLIRNNEFPVFSTTVQMMSVGELLENLERAVRNKDVK